jgi:hypothetical protein
MFGYKKNVLKAKNSPHPLQIDYLINNIRLSRVVSTIKALVFILKVFAIVFIIISIVLGLFFLYKKIEVF